MTTTRNIDLSLYLVTGRELLPPGQVMPLYRRAYALMGSPELRRIA